MPALDIKIKAKETFNKVVNLLMYEMELNVDWC